MQGKWRRAVCCLLAALSATAFSSCDFWQALNVSSPENSASESTEAERTDGVDSSKESAEDSSPKEEMPQSSEENSAEESGEKDSADTSGTNDSFEASDPSDSEEESADGETESDERGESESETQTEGLDFSPKAATEKYGYLQLAKEEKGSGLCAVYADLLEKASEFAASEENVQPKELAGEARYCIAEIPYKKHGLTADEAIAAWKTFRADYPQFWWLSGTITYSGTDLLILIDGEYATGATRAQLQTAVEDMARDCEAYIEKTDCDAVKAMNIYDYLAANVSYAYEADGVTPETDVWAYTIVGGANYGAGVCEMYSETYAWLCELFGLECIVASGDAVQGDSVGGHAWNLLQLDGVWYTVDVTWGDIGGTQNLVSREWFGKAATEFATTHQAYTGAGLGIYWQAALPAASESPLSPVLFRENGGEAETVASLDLAFAKMTNAGGRYEITLYPESDALTGSGGTVYPFGATFTSSLPAVEHLTIVGKKATASTGGYWLSTLTSTNPIVLSSNVTVWNLKWKAPSLHENGYMLIKIGAYAFETTADGE